MTAILAELLAAAAQAAEEWMLASKEQQAELEARARASVEALKGTADDVKAAHEADLAKAEKAIADASK